LGNQGLGERNDYDQGPWFASFMEEIKDSFNYRRSDVAHDPKFRINSKKTGEIADYLEKVCDMLDVLGIHVEDPNFLVSFSEPTTIRFIDFADAIVIGKNGEAYGWAADGIKYLISNNNFKLNGSLREAIEALRKYK
jgi:hypothetical protein